MRAFELVTLLLLLFSSDQTQALSFLEPKLTIGSNNNNNIEKSNHKIVPFQTRREALGSFGGAAAAYLAATATATATWFGGAQRVVAAATTTAAGGSPPTLEELNRLKLGYQQIRYLLDNFEQETTVCRENGGECKRNADPIRKALGLRTTTDPLFQIEKVVFAKVKYMDLDPDALDAFFEASEEWSSAVNMSNSMAFISQFGEYNPGGGQDEVLKYLNESKKQVLLAEKALRTIMNCLGVPVD